MLMHSFSAQQVNSYYLQEDSMNRYLTELKMFFSFSDKFFIQLSFLHLVLLAVSFVVINFYFLSFLVSSICKCVICSNRKNMPSQACLFLVRRQSVPWRNHCGKGTGQSLKKSFTCNSLSILIHFVTSGVPFSLNSILQKVAQSLFSLNKNQQRKDFLRCH